MFVFNKSVNYSLRIVGIIFLLTICINACKTKESVDLAQRKKIIAERIDKSLQHINESYETQNYSDHVAQTASLIKLLSYYPSDALVELDSAIFNQIATNGVEPYLSIIIEYAYRLNRAPTRRTLSRYKDLEKIFWGNFEVWIEQIDNQKATVIIGSMSSSRSYRAFSQNAGFAIAILSMSKVGMSQYSNGSRPESLLRLLELIKSCEDILDKEDEEYLLKNIDSRDRCERLKSAIEELLGAPNESNSPVSMAIEAVANSAQAGIRACLESMKDDTYQTYIRQWEDYKACLEGEMSSSDPLADSYGISGGMKAYVNLDEFLKDYKPKEKENTFFTDLDLGDIDGMGSYKDTKTTYEHKTDPNRNASVTTYATFDGNQFQFGTIVTENNADGQTSSSYNSNGSLTEVNWRSEDGELSYHAEYEDGNMKEEEWVDEDGTTTRVTYNEDGSTIEVKWDKDGNCIKNCANAKKPPRNDPAARPSIESASLCVFPELAGNNDFNPNSWGPYGPWINPDPEDVAPIYDDCLNEFADRPGELENPNCIYVTMCLGEFNDDCVCSEPINPNIFKSFSCNLINCGDGVCDPNTGGCMDSENNPFPGIFEINLEMVELDIQPFQGVPPPFQGN